MSYENNTQRLVGVATSLNNRSVIPKPSRAQSFIENWL